MVFRPSGGAPAADGFAVGKGWVEVEILDVWWVWVSGVVR